MEILLIPEKDKRGIWLDPPIRVDKDYLKKILENPERIKSIIHHLINKDHYHLPEDKMDDPLKPDTMIIMDTAFRHINRILEHDLRLAPFNLYGCEVKGEVLYPLGDRFVNMKYAIDRIDDAECESNPGAIRIVDYKTGGSHITADSMDAVFDGTALSDHYFQLQLYADLLNLRREENGKSKLSIKPVIYPVTTIHRSLSNDQRKKYYPNIGLTTVEWHDQQIEGSMNVQEEFSKRLDSMLEEIFDLEKPFIGEYDRQKCTFCAFKSICR